MGLSTSLVVTHKDRPDFQNTSLLKFGFKFSQWEQFQDIWISNHHHDRFTADRSPNFVRMMAWLGKNGFYGLDQDIGKTFNLSGGYQVYTFSQDEDVEYALKDKQHTRKELQNQNVKPEIIEMMLKNEREVVIE